VRGADEKDGMHRILTMEREKLEALRSDGKGKKERKEKKEVWGEWKLDKTAPGSGGAVKSKL